MPPALKILAAALLLAVVATPARAEFTLRRGIALYDPFMDRSAANQKYFNRTFGDPQALIRDGVLPAIKAAGFDTVRMPVAPRPLIEQTGPLLDRSMAEIFSGIDLILAQGLNVIVDLHTGNGGNPWQNKGLTREPDSPALQRYLEIVSLFAARLKSYPQSRVAFEPFNEPQGPCVWTGGPGWPHFMKRLFDTVRAQAKDLTIVLTGACWGNVDGLVQLDAAAFDSRVIYSFHYYDPHVFTHQGTANTGDAAHYVSRLSYPPQPQQRAAITAAMRSAIAAAPLAEDVKAYLVRQGDAYLARYFDEPVGAPAFETRLRKVKTWAEKHRIPAARIAVGEFGATKDFGALKAAAPDDRARWFSDARRQFEAAGFGWIAWNYHYQGGLIAGDSKGPLDPAMMRALGMRMPGTAR